MANYDTNSPPDVALQQVTPVDIPAQTTFTVGGQSTTYYYQMRGYYAAGFGFETWTAAGAPSVSPPSGHILDSIVIVAQWSG